MGVINKHRKWTFIIAFVLVLLLAFSAIANVSAAGSDTVVETTFFGNLKDDGKGCGVYHILNLVVDILSIGVGIVGVVGVSIVGVQYITAGSNEQQTTKAKRRIVEIVIGLVAFAVLYAFMQWLLPGGKLSTTKCETVSDEDLASMKAEEREVQQGSAGGGYGSGGGNSSIRSNNKSSSNSSSNNSSSNSSSNNSSNNSSSSSNNSSKYGSNTISTSKGEIVMSPQIAKKYTPKKFAKLLKKGKIAPASKVCTDCKWKERIAQTAELLSYPKGTKRRKYHYDGNTYGRTYKKWSDMKGAKPNKAYRKALNKIKRKIDFSSMSALGADCGHFVTIVLRYSGHDRKMRYGQADSYFKKHKWKKVKKAKRGDVCIHRPGFHIWIYLGKGRSAEANHFGKNFGHISKKGCKSASTIWRVTDDKK